MDSQTNQVAVGMSQDTDSMKAGHAAARMAVDRLDRTQPVGWALAFCGGRHDRDIVLQGLRSVLGDVPVVGGAAVGAMTNDLAAYSGFECAVAVFSAAWARPAIVAVDGLEDGEANLGRRLAAGLRDVAHEGDTVLLFYDSIKSGPPPVLYAGSRLLDGFYESAAAKNLKLIGAGMLGDFQFSESYVFDGRQASKHAVVAVVLPSVLDSRTVIMHGCVPISSFREITRIEGPVVYEIDGRAALDVLMEVMGKPEGSPTPDNLAMFVTLGEKHGDPYAPYDESSYVNRLIIGADRQAGSVTLFEADFRAGTKVQIMSRDNELMLMSARQRTQELLASLGAEQPVLGLYIDCAGRTCGFSGAEVEDASILQSAIRQTFPFLGLYSGVEIAPLMGRSRPLDWTGVLTLFTLRRTPDERSRA